MNRQDNKKNRGIEWTAPYRDESSLPYQGWTWNPIKGCQHACAWQMPNGDRAQCYAKSIAEGMASGAYPQGFAHLRFDDEELLEVFKRKYPAGIFSDSMSDLLGLGVNDEWIERILDVMSINLQHIFFVLTKRVVRMPVQDWPSNVWLGVSAPPTFMHKDSNLGHKLSTSEGRLAWYRHALMMLSESKASVKWSSIEPLSDDFSPVLEEWGSALDWVVLGAASNGRETIQPDEAHFANTLNTLDKLGIPCFYKGNISRKLAEKYGGWREFWPYYEPAFQRIAELEAPKEPAQKSLF